MASHRRPIQSRKKYQLYYSEYCGNSKQIINLFKRTPQVAAQFSKICVDRYFKKHRRFPENINGTPTIWVENQSNIQVYEGEDVFKLISDMINGGNNRRGGGRRGNRDDHEDYGVQRDPRVREMVDDPGYDHKKYMGSTHRPSTWGTGASVTAHLPPDEWPSWANVDGERNPDPSQLLERGNGKVDKKDVQKSVAALIKKREIAESQYKNNIKRRGRPPAVNNRRIRV